MASNLKELPLNHNPNQTFNSTLNINGNNVLLGFFLRFSEVSGYWLLDILKEGVSVIAGLPLVPGEETSQNILRQYGHLRIGEAYLVLSFAT